MVAPVFHKITQGETLEIEVRFVGEGLETATPRIETSAGFSPSDFTAVVVVPDTVTVTATSTQAFSLGTHELHLWLDWSDGSKEVGLSTLIHVSPDLDFWHEGMGILDGGTASTNHEDFVDGGPA